MVYSEVFVNHFAFKGNSYHRVNEGSFLISHRFFFCLNQDKMLKKSLCLRFICVLISLHC